MFEKYKDKSVKILVKDGFKFKSLRAVFLGVEGDEGIAFCNFLIDGKDTSIPLKNIEKMRLDEEENYGEYNNNRQTLGSQEDSE